MKRVLCVLLAATVVLSGCQKSSGTTDDKTKAREETERREEDETERLEEEDFEKEETDEKEDDREEAPKDSEAEPIEAINLDISGEYDSEWQEGSMMIQASCSKLHVLDEGYESFQVVLDEYNDRNWNEVQAIYQEFLPQAIDQYAMTGFAEYEISRIINLDRADTRIVSFTNEESSYLGGAHGSYYTKGVNFDPISGKQLSLKDVAEDYDQVYEYTKAYLEKEYTAEAFFPDYQDTLEKMFYGGAEETSPLEWSMDTTNLTLYFSQYVLGPYSSGAFAVDIPFEGDTQFVKAEYIPEIEGMMKKVWEGEKILLEGKENGQEQPFSYTIWRNEAEFSNTITISWGPENVEKEFYGGISQVYVVQNPDGKYWLYVETLEDNDWRSLHVFDLNQEAAVYVDSMYNYIGNNHLVTDPEYFTLYTRMNTLGTYMAYRHYRVGDNGMPEAVENVYTIVNYDRGWGRYAITSKVDLPVQMYADGGMRRTEEILPAGTRFYLCRTDGVSFVEMELEDGRRCDILIEVEDYFSKVNGMDEGDCFDGLMYAG